MFPPVIEPEPLAEHLQNPDLLIVDLCKPENYSRHHLPGAIHVAPASLVSGIRPAVGKLPEPETINRLFSSLGYSPDRPIVAYDDEGGGWAGRFLWTLDVIGHRHSTLLNGGLVAWKAAGLPLTDVPGTAEPTRTDLHYDRRFIADKDDVLKSLDDPDTLIWDARSAEEYAGEKRLAEKAGHIPGAIHLDWLETMDHDRQLRLRQDLPELLESKGLLRDKSIITHCQTHHRSGLTYFIGKLLGYDIRAYPGSWSEWGNDPDTPVET